MSSPEVAEAAKLLENTFRAVNIALVNELKIVFDRMGIDVWEVIEAAKTKPFGFMPFYPGPGLGGHCIPLDPFYLTWKAAEYGVWARFIELAGEINTGMPHYVVDQTARALNRHGKSLKGAKVLVLGLSYKADIDDDRESPSFEIIELLRAAGAEVAYCDPYIPVARSRARARRRPLVGAVHRRRVRPLRRDPGLDRALGLQGRGALLAREARRRHPQPRRLGRAPAPEEGPRWCGPKPVRLFVPGRICLFGEHSDWAGGYRRINADIEKGYTLICGTNQGIHAEVEPHPTALVLTSTTPEGKVVGPYEIPLEPRRSARGGAARRLLQLRRRRRLPGAHALPRARAS